MERRKPSDTDIKALSPADLRAAATALAAGSQQDWLSAADLLHRTEDETLCIEWAQGRDVEEGLDPSLLDLAPLLVSGLRNVGVAFAYELAGSVALENYAFEFTLGLLRSEQPLVAGAPPCDSALVALVREALNEAPDLAARIGKDLDLNADELINSFEVDDEEDLDEFGVYLASALRALDALNPSSWGAVRLLAWWVAATVLWAASQDSSMRPDDTEVPRSRRNLRFAREASQRATFHASIEQVVSETQRLEELGVWEPNGPHWAQMRRRKQFLLGYVRFPVDDDPTDQAEAERMAMALEVQNLRPW